MVEKTDIKIRVDERNKEKFVESFNKLNKRGNKLGVKIYIYIKEGEIEYVNLLDKSNKTKYLRKEELDSNNNYRKILVYYISLVMPDLKGLQIVANLNHTGKGNIVSVIDNTLAKKYNTNQFGNLNDIQPICDHCNQKRKRRYLYLLYDVNNNTYIRVGKSCLKNFNNTIDIDKIYTFLDSFANFKDKNYLITTDNTFYVLFDTLFSNYLKMMYMDIRDRNNIIYIRYSEDLIFSLSNHSKTTISGQEIDLIYWDKYKEYNEIGYKDDLYKIKETILKYVGNDVNKNNLKITIKNNLILNKTVNTILYNLFNVTKDYMKEKYLFEYSKNLIENDNYFGEEGNKYLDKKLTIISNNTYINSYNGDIGFIVTFKTEDNISLVWFTQTNILDKIIKGYLKNNGYSREDVYDGNVNLEDYPTQSSIIGLDIITSFTVKKHNLYKGKKSTIIKNIRKIDII